MPRKRKYGSRVFWKGIAAPAGKGYSRDWFEGGRTYSDFRNIGGSIEALKEPGSTVTTSDPDIANALASAIVKRLESEKRGLALIGTASVPRLGEFAAHHLKQKKLHGECTDWTLGGVQRSLERAVEFFGASRPLASIKVSQVQD